VTMSAPSTSPPTPFSISAPSTWKIDLHFVRERVAIGAVHVLRVPTTSQFADVFTKGLPSSVFIDFRSNLNVRSTDVPTAGVLEYLLPTCMRRLLQAGLALWATSVSSIYM
jgi:hypothetical protein